MTVASISHKWRAHILLTLFGICLAFVLGELVIRVYYGDKYSKRPPFYGPHENLGWAPTPNLNHTFWGLDFTMHIQTDQLGHRLGSLGNVDYTKNLIVLCGDSQVFGWGVSTDETFASYLDEIVDVYTDGRMRVVNLGVGGYGTWQYHQRLRNLTVAYPEVKFSAIVVAHCQNDPSDNVVTIGYTEGFWETGPVPNEKNRWHLVNFLRHARERYQRARAHENERKALMDKWKSIPQDELWSYKTKSTPKLPAVLYFGADSVDISGRKYKDLSDVLLMSRKSMTRIQRELYRYANKYIHELAAEMDCGVYHTFVYSSDDWYINEADSLIEESATARVVNLGRIPHAGEFEGDYINKHSGNHYTPQFNQFWAQKMFEQLKSAGVLETSIR